MAAVDKTHSKALDPADHEVARQHERTPAQVAAEHEAQRAPREMFDDLVGRLEHQMKHNGPVTPGLVAELKAIIEKL